MKPPSISRTIRLLPLVLPILVAGCSGADDVAVGPAAADYSWVTTFAEKALETADQTDNARYLAANPNLPRWPGSVAVVIWMPPEVATMESSPLNAIDFTGWVVPESGHLAALEQVRGHRPGGEAEFPPSFWEIPPAGQGNRADTWGLFLYKVLVNSDTTKSAYIGVSLSTDNYVIYLVTGHLSGVDWVVDHVSPRVIRASYGERLPPSPRILPPQVTSWFSTLLISKLILRFKRAKQQDFGPFTTTCHQYFDHAITSLRAEPWGYANLNRRGAHHAQYDENGQEIAGTGSVWINDRLMVEWDDEADDFAWTARFIAVVLHEAAHHAGIGVEALGGFDDDANAPDQCTAIVE